MRRNKERNNKDKRKTNEAAAEREGRGKEESMRSDSKTKARAAAKKQKNKGQNQERGKERKQQTQSPAHISLLHHKQLTPKLANPSVVWFLLFVPNTSRSRLQSDESGFGSWFDGCQYVYLDVGTNVGVQIRKLYEPELYPGAKMLSFFDEQFGHDRKRLSSLCTVGFEPNIHHTSKLRALETAYTARGWRVKIFTETAVSTIDGNATFFFDKIANPQQHEWAASLIPWHESMKTKSGSDTERNDVQATVQTMDFSRYLLVNIGRRRINEELKHSVLMKLDVEGSEHTILPHIITTGSICSINKIFLENHRWGAIEFSDGSNDTQFTSFFKQFVEKYNVTSCPTSILDVDDESYHDSDFPLPDSRETT